MIENEGFKFGCPYCSQHIRAFLEHVGYDIACPTCGGALFVPDPTGVTDMSTLFGFPIKEEDDQDSPQEQQGFDQDQEQYASPEEVDTHGFGYDEWQILQEEDYEAVERITQLDRNLWWECGAAAELIQCRLSVLAEAVSPEREIYYHPGTQDEHMAFLYHIDQRARDFCDIMNFTYHVMTNELKRACVQQSLMTVIQFADRIGREAQRLREFHNQLYEHSLPQEQPFPEIQQIMVAWAPCVYAGLSHCTRQLMEKATHDRGTWSDARLQTSFFPANLPKFFTLKDKLAARFAQYQR